MQPRSCATAEPYLRIFAMDTGFSLTVISLVILAIALWPLAHIPIGAPLLLARNEGQEINPFVLAASLAIGQIVLSAATYLLYLLGLRFPLVGFMTAALMLPIWLWGIVLMARRKWDIILPRWLLVGLLITMSLILLRLIKGVVHDEGLHFPKVASILLGDHPLFVPNGTAGYLRAYHFGVDYLAAFWTWAIFPFRQWFPFNAIAFWSSAATYVLLYFLFRRFISEPGAIIAPFLAFWLGNWYSPLGLLDIIFEGRSLIAILMNAISPTFFSYFIQAPMVFGMPALISAMCLAAEGRFMRAGVLAGVLLLANQVLFAMWLGYSLFGFFRGRRYLIALLTSLIACVPFLPYLAGGAKLSDSPSFVLGLPILNLVTARNLPHYLNYLLFFFPLLPFYLHGAFIVLKGQKRADMVPLVAITSICLVIPHLIAHSQAGHLFKLLMLWGVFGMPAILTSVELLWKKSRFWRGALFLLLAPSLLSLILGFGITSARTRRLVKYERLRPDIIAAQKALGGKGGAFVLQNPMKYSTVSGDTVDYQGLDFREIERLFIVLVGAGIPRYPSEQIYGKARDFYQALGRRWPSLDEIPDSILASRSVRFVALSREWPIPSVADSVVFETSGIVIARLRYHSEYNIGEVFIFSPSPAFSGPGIYFHPTPTPQATTAQSDSELWLIR